MFGGSVVVSTEPAGHLRLRSVALDRRDISLGDIDLGNIVLTAGFIVVTTLNFRSIATARSLVLVDLLNTENLNLVVQKYH